MAIDLQNLKMSSEEKVSLCKHYFYLGFLCLPFLWGINAAWFFGEAFRKPIFEGQGTIKKLVLMSFIGCLLWTIGLVSWVAVFTINR